MSGILVVYRGDIFLIVIEGKEENFFWISFLLEIFLGRNCDYVVS